MSRKTKLPRSSARTDPKKRVMVEEETSISTIWFGLNCDPVNVKKLPGVPSSKLHSKVPAGGGNVAVAVGVEVGCEVAVGVGVAPKVAVGVGDPSGVGVIEGVAGKVAVGVAEGVAVAAEVGVGVTEGVTGKVAVGVGVNRSSK